MPVSYFGYVCRLPYVTLTVCRYLPPLRLSFDKLRITQGFPAKAGSLPSAYCSLPSAYCLLPTAYSIVYSLASRV